MHMDTANIAKIKQGLNELCATDIDSIVTSLIPDTQSIDVPILDVDTPPSVFLHLYKRAISQFRSEITRSDAPFLLPLLFPTEMNTVVINGQPQFRAENICTVINNMLDSTLTKNYQNMVIQLKKIISYQVFCGFFDRSSIKQHTGRGLNLNEKINRVDAILQKTANLEQKTATLLAESSNLKKTIEDTILNASNAEKEAASLKEKAEISLTSINKSLNSISETKGKTDQIQKEIESIKEKANKQMDSHDKEIDALRKSAEELEQNMQLKISTYDKHIKTLNNSMQTFNERSLYLDELIGREVGASLFETFKQRKKEFHIGWWFFAVILISILSVAWVYIVFSGAFNNILPESTFIGWQLFALNTLKCVPVVYLIYFVTKQYSLERRFQEEYAFKSAVALTIKAYADLLSDGANKDQLILQSVTSIQKPPGALSGHPRGKNIEDAALSMMEKMPEAVTEMAKTISKLP